MIHRVWKQNLYAAPSIGLSLLPKIACPACWPAYAGLLSSIGLGFLIPNRVYLLPLTALFLVVAIGTLALGARREHGYAPLTVGAIAAVLILAGKFSLESNSTFYAGLGMLVLASVWNSWPMAPRCECAPAARIFNTPERTTWSAQPQGEREMTTPKRKVEVFTAGCGLCDETIALVQRLACGSCDVSVHDMHEATIASKARQYGVHTVPAVVIDGRLADCCSGAGSQEQALRAAGLGAAL